MNIDYSISMDEPETHYFRVKMRIRGYRDRTDDTGEDLRLVMPVWTPGSYLVREYSRNVLDVEAAFGGGGEGGGQPQQQQSQQQQQQQQPARRPLAVEKDTKNSWIIRTAGVDTGDDVTMTYRVYAFQLGTNTSYLDTHHAVINGASVFMYVEGLKDEPIELEVFPHASWKVVSTGLEPAQGAAGDGMRFTAPDFDRLVDSPIEVGNQHVHWFEVAGTRHEVSIYAPKTVDEGALVSDIKKIVESAIPVYGVALPYTRYLFLVDFSEEKMGGLEHLNSTHCIVSYYRMEPPQEYRQLLTLFSHEYFHVWNVKRMRPVGLGPFDYTSETYTRSLWIAEGLTSYYEDIILRRAGIDSVSDYLDAVSTNLNVVKSLPAYRTLSPEEASFDTWVRFYRQDENTPNVSPSYYEQGAVLGLVLDLQIRKETANRRSLDDALRKVYADTYTNQNRGYTDREFEAACVAVAADGRTEGGSSIAEIFTRHVRGREEIDFSHYLGYAGLELVPKSGAQQQQEGFLGIKFRPGAWVFVGSRLFDTPAERADLSAGDEIIAIDGLRVDGAKLAFYIANRRPGSTVALTIAREGVLSSVEATLVARPTFEHRVQKKATASPEEKALFQSWLQASWDAALQYSEYRASPVKRRLLDYI